MAVHECVKLSGQGACVTSIESNGSQVGEDALTCWFLPVGGLRARQGGATSKVVFELWATLDLVLGAPCICTSDSRRDDEEEACMGTRSSSRRLSAWG